jgi:hypothetical protein
VAPQSGEKDQVYSIVYYITLKANMRSSESTKNIGKNMEDRVRSQ